jgi:hypothetical protein
VIRAARDVRAIDWYIAPWTECRSVVSLDLTIRDTSCGTRRWTRMERQTVLDFDDRSLSMTGAAISRSDRIRVYHAELNPVKYFLGMARQTIYYSYDIIKVRLIRFVPACTASSIRSKP